MGYNIKRVETLPELQTAFASGFIDLFDECFGIAPYFLKYPDDELFKIYSDHVKTGFVLFAYSDDKLVGFAGSRPLMSDEYVDDEVKAFFRNPEEYFYHSDLGVAVSERGKGLAKLLIKESIFHTPTTKILMRTKEDNAPSIALHMKMGFKPLDLTQVIKRKDSFGHDIDDKRIYLVYDKERENSV